MPAQLLDHDGYHEIHLSGRLLRDILAARLEGLDGARRILIDYSDVTGIDAPLEGFVSLTRQTDVNGIRVAIHAPSSLAFGWNRQVLQLAGAREGLTISVFRDRTMAIAWLMADGAGASAFGGSSRHEPPFESPLAWPA